MITRIGDVAALFDRAHAQCVHGNVFCTVRDDFPLTFVVNAIFDAGELCSLGSFRAGQEMAPNDLNSADLERGGSLCEGDVDKHHGCAHDPSGLRGGVPQSALLVEGKSAW